MSTSCDIEILRQVQDTTIVFLGIGILRDRHIFHRDTRCYINPVFPLVILTLFLRPEIEAVEPPPLHMPNLGNLHNQIVIDRSYSRTSVWANGVL